MEFYVATVKYHCKRIRYAYNHPKFWMWHELYSLCYVDVSDKLCSRVCVCVFVNWTFSPASVLPNLRSFSFQETNGIYTYIHLNRGSCEPRFGSIWNNLNQTQLNVLHFPLCPQRFSNLRIAFVSSIWTCNGIYAQSLLSNDRWFCVLWNSKCSKSVWNAKSFINRIFRKMGNKMENKNNFRY